VDTRAAERVAARYTYAPPMQRLSHTVSFDVRSRLIIAGMSSLLFLAREAGKERAPAG